MKQIVISISLVLFFASIVIASDKTEICFLRAEDNGVLNIKAAQIMINGKHLMEISGGEKKCHAVEPGQYIIVVQSSDPYDPNDKNPSTWKSKPLKTDVKAGTKKQVTISPRVEGAAYTGPWELK